MPPWHLSSSFASCGANSGLGAVEEVAGRLDSARADGAWDAMKATSAVIKASAAVTGVDFSGVLTTIACGVFKLLTAVQGQTVVTVDSFKCNRSLESTWLRNGQGMFLAANHS